jgi:hypothetical protein
MPLLDLTPTREPTRVAILGLAGIVLFVLAGRDLQDQQLSLVTAAALLLGVVAWLAAAARCVREAEPMPTISYGVRIPLLVTAVVLAAGAWLSSGTGSYTNTNLAFWPAATAAWLLAWWPRRQRVKVPSLSRSDVATLLALGAVICVASFFHFHQLSTVPGEPTSDHAEKLLDVRDVLNGEHPIFFARNTGREPAQFYVTAALIRWFGQPLSWETLKVGTALIGVLAVVAIFFLGTELGGRPVGLVAAATAAVSAWPVGVDRMGLRFPYAILASALTLWLAFRYLRSGDRRDALACGVAIAFGLHGYSPFRVLLLAVAVVFVIALARAPRGPSRRQAVGNAALAYATAFIASVPLARYAVQHPDLVLMRQTSRLEAPLGVGGTLSTFGDNVRNAFLAFHWRGDGGWTVSVVGRPFLDSISGALLLAGVVVLVAIAITRRSPVALAALLVMPVVLLSSALDLAFPNENPSANRMGIAVPLVFAVAALPIGVLWRAICDVGAASQAPQRILLAAYGVALLGGLALVAANNYTSYFRDFRDQYHLSAQNTSEVATALTSRGVQLERMFLVAYPTWVDGRNLALALGDFDWYEEHDIAPGAPIPALVGSESALYALHPDDDTNRDELRRRHPDGEYVAVSSSVGRDFRLYVVPGGP